MHKKCLELALEPLRGVVLGVRALATALVLVVQGAVGSDHAFGFILYLVLLG